MVGDGVQGIGGGDGLGASRVRTNERLRLILTSAPFSPLQKPRSALPRPEELSPARTRSPPLALLLRGEGRARRGSARGPPHIPRRDGGNARSERADRGWAGGGGAGPWLHLFLLLPREQNTRVWPRRASTRTRVGTAALGGSACERLLHAGAGAPRRGTHGWGGVSGWRRYYGQRLRVTGGRHRASPASPPRRAPAACPRCRRPAGACATWKLRLIDTSAGSQWRSAQRAIGP